MARSALTVTEVGLAGAQETLVAANVDGHSVANDGQTFLIVKNDGASSLTVTMQTPGKYQGVSLTNPTVMIAAGVTKLIKLPHPAVANDPSGATLVDFSTVASVTLAAFKLA